MTQFKPGFEVPAEMREFAEKSVSQARKAVDGFIGAANKAVTTSLDAMPVPEAAKDGTRQAMGFAEQNIAASFDFAERLLQAKDWAEIAALQTAFVQSQMNALTAQSRAMGANLGKGEGTD